MSYIEKVHSKKVHSEKVYSPKVYSPKFWRRTLAAWFLVSVFASLFITEITLADSSFNPKQVQTQVQRLMKAVYGNDVETTMMFTNEKVIAMLGGLEHAKKVTSEALAQIQDSGMILEQLSFPTGPVFLKGKDTDFVVVPTRSILAVGSNRVESINYQFGVRKVGEKNWTYIEGSRVGKHNVFEMFPDFPTDYTFPAVSRKRIKP